MSDLVDAAWSVCMAVCMICIHFRLNHIERLIKEDKR